MKKVLYVWAIFKGIIAFVLWAIVGSYFSGIIFHIFLSNNIEEIRLKWIAGFIVVVGGLFFSIIIFRDSLRKSRAVLDKANCQRDRFNEPSVTSEIQ